MLNAECQMKVNVKKKAGDAIGVPGPRDDPHFGIQHSSFVIDRMPKPRRTAEMSNYDPPALRGVVVFAPLPRVSALPPFPRSGRAGFAFFGAAPSPPSSPSSPSAFFPRSRSAAARRRPPTPF